MVSFTTSITNWTRIEFGLSLPEITFVYLSTTNVYYKLFSKLQERSLPALEITTGSIITIYYNKYSELFKSLENQLILDNDEIAGDIGEVRKAKNKGDKKMNKDNDKVVERRD